MEQTLERAPAVAGRFYPATAAALREELERLFAEAAGAPPARRRAIAAVVPHAGYMYSGGVAARVFARLELPLRVVILAPNHTGLGPPLSAWPGGRWRTPLGAVEIDEELLAAVCAACPELVREREAHRYEHAAEVEVPFLQRLRPEVRIAPIVVGTQREAVLRALGEGLAEAVRALGGEVLLLASTDLNHYEDQAATLRKDELALEPLLALEPERLLEVCRRERISMCGLAPTAATLFAARALGARRAELIDHRTSGEVSGDYERVVGYAGVLID
ncbi:MAG: MEMO1 family protein [Planctomycetota bacterium]|nr:MAG: MEMO1 family protein [Planctomycetota bacterium]